MVVGGCFRSFHVLVLTTLFAPWLSQNPLRIAEDPITGNSIIVN